MGRAEAGIRLGAGGGVPPGGDGQKCWMYSPATIELATFVVLLIPVAVKGYCTLLLDVKNGAST